MIRNNPPMKAPIIISISRQTTFTLKARNVEKQPSTSEGCGYQDE
jgi:hypothetical protein